MYATLGGSDTGVPKKVAREFVASDKPGKLPAHVKRAEGGSVDPIDLATHVARMPMQIGGASWAERQAARMIERPSSGFLMGTGSYVLPGDIVSGLAEGNSLGGSALIDKMFHSMPYGITANPIHHGIGLPRAPAPFHETPGRAKGGEADGDEELIPIAAADGEIILRPDQVYTIGRTYLPKGKPTDRQSVIDHGHDVLDAFVKHVRGKTIKEQKKLPGPHNSKNPDEGHTATA
jgi:hypothetical protein